MGPGGPIESGEAARACEMGPTSDGPHIHLGHESQFRRFTDEVVPILRDSYPGLVRPGYESQMLRGHLGLPVRENRGTAARRGTAPGGRRGQPRRVLCSASLVVPVRAVPAPFSQ